jgi:uncharacterized membrane protein YkvA (DUF1232 family)
MQTIDSFERELDRLRRDDRRHRELLSEFRRRRLAAYYRWLRRDNPAIGWLLLGVCIGATVIFLAAVMAL